MSTAEAPDIVIEMFDTTLRDGDQAESVFHQIPPGRKVEVAEAIASLGVSTIEAGFPATKGDTKEVRAVAESVGKNAVTFSPVVFREGVPYHGAPVTRKPVITGLTMAVPEHIELTWDAVSAADNPGIHVFVPTSNIHIKEKLGGNKSPDDVIKLSVESVRYAREISGGRALIEFSSEDAIRSDHEYLERLAKEVMQTGCVDVLNFPNTVGHAQYYESEVLFKKAANWVIDAGEPGVTKLSTHNHNDNGQATANTVAAARSAINTTATRGRPLVFQIEAVIGGRGERAGNQDTAQADMNIQTKPDLFIRPVQYEFESDRLLEVTNFVLGVMNLRIPDKAPVVGSEVIVHRSGVHAAAMAKNPRTYAPVDMRGFGHEYAGVVEDAKYQGTRGRQFIDETGGFITRYV